MIAFITGKIILKNEKRVIALAGQVGYEVNITAPTSNALGQKGDIVSLHISQSLSMYSGTTLYGFSNEDEKNLFETLKSMPKTGAKKALEYLAKAQKSLPDFKNAVIKKDIKILTGIFGFTKKTAEKIHSSLKEKISELNISGTPKIKQTALGEEKEKKVMDALLSLGFKTADSRLALENAGKNLKGPESVEEVLKLALKTLSVKN